MLLFTILKKKSQLIVSFTADKDNKPIEDELDDSLEYKYTNLYVWNNPATLYIGWILSCLRLYRNKYLAKDERYEPDGELEVSHRKFLNYLSAYAVSVFFTVLTVGIFSNWGASVIVGMIYAIPIFFGITSLYIAYWPLAELYRQSNIFIGPLGSVAIAITLIVLSALNAVSSVDWTFIVPLLFSLATIIFSIAPEPWATRYMMNLRYSHLYLLSEDPTSYFKESKSAPKKLPVLNWGFLKYFFFSIIFGLWLFFCISLGVGLITSSLLVAPSTGGVLFLIGFFWAIAVFVNL